MRRDLSAAIGLALVLTTAGCTIGPYGTTAVRYTYTPTALIAEKYSVGGIYEPAGPAAILGISRSLHIYKNASQTHSGSEWRFGHAPLPEGSPVYMSQTSVGIEGDATFYRYGVCAGLLNQTVAAWPESGTVRFIYDANLKEKTHVETSEQK